MGKEENSSLSTRRKCTSMIDKPLIHPFLFNKPQVLKKKYKQQLKLDDTNLTEQLSNIAQKIVLKNTIPNQFLKVLCRLKKAQRVCILCREMTMRMQTLQCHICEDVYHAKCLPKTDKKQKRHRRPKRWTCQRCLDMKEALSSSEEQMETKCSKCLECVDEEEECNCLRCHSLFHLSCMPASCPPLCEKCTFTLPEIYLQIPAGDPIPPCSFHLPILCNDGIMKECVNSLLFALKCQNISYSDTLNYKVPIENNNATLEPLIQPLPKQCFETFDRFKEITHAGYYGPLKVEYREDQGFYVRSVATIPARTLLCEYVGDVHIFAKQVYSRSDSMMTLLETSQASSTLVIVPEECGNIAKYLSGINNSKKDSKARQQNVISQRFNIKGQARVLLISSRTIQENEILYYDYNEGGKYKYNTRNFI